LRRFRVPQKCGGCSGTGVQARRREQEEVAGGRGGEQDIQVAAVTCVEALPLFQRKPALWVA